MHLMLSTVLLFAGIGAALALFAANLLLLRAHGQRWNALFYMGVALVYGVLLAMRLVRQSSGIACAMTPARTLFVYGGLLLLQLGFIWDTIRLLRKGEEAG